MFIVSPYHKYFRCMFHLKVGLVDLWDSHAQSLFAILVPSIIKNIASAGREGNRGRG